MKKCIQFIVFALALTSTLVFAQVREVRNVDKFTAITNGTSATVYLKQGSGQRVEVEAKKELLASIVTEVSGGRLKISSKNMFGKSSWFSKDDIKIYVTAESIDAIDLFGSGNLTALTPLNANNMSVTLNGSGDMEAELALTGQLDMGLSGSGNLNLKGKVQNLKAHVNGSGDAVLAMAVTNQAEFDISGSGEIHASGKAPVMVASISGSGDLSASDFMVDTGRIHVSGSGDASVNVSRDLDASTSGSGDVTYKGNPARVNTHNSGSGSINKSQ